MTIPRLAERVGRSRTLLHRLAANPAEGWPEPTYRPGSTRPEYDVAWFDEYWARRQAGIRQGKRTDLAKKKQGEPAVIEGQMGTQPLNGSDARAILRIVWKWIEDANDGLGSDVGDLQHELESAGYGPLEESSDG
ncbi:MULTISPECIES: hypothetical protein [unclassified Streptomyces]|uniref:hypothetical protein n=1 Tax=unclassified Streptomyces TaxID=2593676 RepID=UPI000AD39799|nr:MULTISPECIES: hypothetical protein [unclassified Streptomyces]